MNLTVLATLFRGHGARTQAQLNATGRHADPGQKIGIEFELEDWSGSVPESGWDTHSDASLRNGIEFVFNGPKFGRTSENALERFRQAAEACTFTVSERTSTHVHLDMGDGATIGDARKMFLLTYLIEPAMFRMADENRKWCSYCQPLTDMTQARISGIIASDSIDAFVSAATGGRHQDKYYAFNMKSLSRHQTIEFRYFPGYQSMEQVDKWINLTMEIKKAAVSVESIEELMAIAVDRDRFRAWLTTAMPVSVANGLLTVLDEYDANKRAQYLNAIMATSDLPTAAMHQRLQNVQPGSAAAKMLDAIFSIRFDAESQRSEALRRVLRSGGLNRDDLDALRQVVSQMQNGREFEQLIARHISNNN